MKYPVLLLPIMLPLAAVIYCCAFIRYRVVAEISTGMNLPHSIDVD
jgi:hypothetical protein